MMSIDYDGPHEMLHRYMRMISCRCRYSIGDEIVRYDLDNGGVANFWWHKGTLVFQGEAGSKLGRMFLSLAGHLATLRKEW